jgi:hypothetical protein
MAKGRPQLYGVALAAQGRGRRKFSLSRWRFGPEAFGPRLKNRPICILELFLTFFFCPCICLQLKNYHSSCTDPPPGLDDVP